MTSDSAGSGKWLERVGHALLALGIVGSALALGAIHSWVLCLVAAVLVAGATCVWMGAGAMRTRPAASLVLFVGIGLTAYTALQAIPLPITWLARIAPHNADVWARALEPLHETGPSWAPISLDPIATRLEIVRGVAYLCAFLATLRIVSTRRGPHFIAAVVIATSVVLALAALLHPAFGIEKVYGIYEPRGTFEKRHIAPLLNPNHLVAYLNIGLCLSLAAALARDPAAPRILTGACALLLCGTQFFVASRGGVLSMAIGSGLIVWASWGARRKEVAGPKTTLLVSSAIAMGGVALLALGASDSARDEMLVADASKLTLIRQTLRMVPLYPLFGAGRGAFESTYPEVRTGTYHVVYTHPENLFAQWATEWGLPISIVGATLLIWALRPTAALVRARTTTGAWAALVAVAVHNFVDFSLEVPAVVIAMSACAAIAVAGSAGHTIRWYERWSFRPVGPVVALIGAAAVALGVRSIDGELARDREQLREKAAGVTTSLTAMHDAVRAAMLRHPAEPFLPFAVALRAAHARDESVVPWVDRTLERAPVYAPAHFVLARWLAPGYPAQARLEYRIALEQAPNLGGWILAESPRLVGSYDDALELVPAGPLAIEMMEQIIGARGAALPATAARLDDRIRSLAPQTARTLVRAARAGLDDLRAGEAAPWCTGDERRQCIQRALDLAVRLEAAAPLECEGFALHAEIVAEVGSITAAVEELESAADRVLDRSVCLRRLVDLARSVKVESTTDRALNNLVQAACTEPKECVENLEFVANAELSRGHFRVALAAWKRASALQPDNDALLASVATTAVRAGIHLEAMRAYEELARRHPDDRTLADAVSAERAQVLNGSIHK